MSSSTALLTDRYELTMLDGALRSGVATRPSTFEVFSRRLPEGRTAGVFAGLGRLLEAIERFRFHPDQLAWLASAGVVSRDAIDWLAEYRFSGSIDAYDEGDLYTVGSPVMTVEAPFGEAVLLETLILSVLNHDSAVASAASLLAAAAGERPIIEMGSRRTDPRAAVAAARSAYLGGFESTSNLEAGRTYAIPTAGTAAHAFVLAHDSEREAFAAQVETLGPGTTLLVDTFDVEAAIRTAVEVAGPGLGAIRIDSGDPVANARMARALLDRLGATGTRIIITGDLEDHLIKSLAPEPVDGYGVGTNVVTGLGEPTAAFVYKLVAIGAGSGGQQPVAKLSAGKETVGGRKRAWRVRMAELPPHAEGPVPSWSGPAWTDVVVADPTSDCDWPVADPSWLAAGRPLQRRVVKGGDLVAPEALDAARRRHRERRGEQPLFLVRAREA